MNIPVVSYSQKVEIGNLALFNGLTIDLSD